LTYFTPLVFVNWDRWQAKLFPLQIDEIVHFIDSPLFRDDGRKLREGGVNIPGIDRHIPENRHQLGEPDFLWTSFMTLVA
jgi:hypothetical protein